MSAKGRGEGARMEIAPGGTLFAVVRSVDHGEGRMLKICAPRNHNPFLSYVMSLALPALASCGMEQGEKRESVAPDGVGKNEYALITDHIGHWKFDETSGTTAADSYTATPDPGTLYNGTTVGAYPNGPRWTSPGIVDGAITFDGVNDNVRIGDSGYGPAFSLAFWFRINNNSGAHATFFTHGTAYTADSIMIRMAGAGSGSIWTYVCDSADTSCGTGYGTSNPPGGEWDDGQWHHYVLTISSTQDSGKVYIDGQYRNAVPRGGSSINPSGQMYIGRRNDEQYPLNGAMDELRLYNRELSAADVTELFNWRPSTCAPSDHIGHWKLDESTGTTAYDSYTGTPDNGTLYEGSTAGVQGPTWQAGRIQGALKFDGVNDNLQITDSGYGPAFSLAFWFRVLDNSGGHGTLVAHGTHYTQNSVMMRIAGSGDGSIWTYVCDGSDTSCGTGYGTSNPPGGNWGDGQWHHYALTVSSTQDSAKVYVDGVYRNAIPRGGSTINPSGNFYVGRGSDGLHPLNGMVDDLRLYNRELSASDITSLFNCPGDGTPPVVSMTLPTAGLTITGNTTVSAEATDNVGVASVTFQVDGSDFHTDTTFPYSTTYDSTLKPNGTHSFSARAVDASGNSRTATPVSVTFDNPSNPGPATVTHFYDHSNVDIKNPERGWYYGVDLVDGASGVDDIYAEQSKTLAIELINLRCEFKDRGLSVYNSSHHVPQDLIDKLRAALGQVRAYGFKVILRFKYRDEGSDPGCDGDSTGCRPYDDPPVANIQMHINDLKDTFDDYSDVIFLIQAGWVGRWGEFNDDHDCYGYLFPTDETDDWMDIMDTHYDALPEERMTAFRYPDLKDRYLNARGYDTDQNPFLDGEAFQDNKRSEIGHYGDCILRNEHDGGTFDEPPSIAHWRNYLIEEAAWTPYGGETCLDDDDADDWAQCSYAEGELRARHLTYLNSQYDQDVINNDPSGLWYQGGCRSDISREMGYRFDVDEVTRSQRVRPGDALQITVKITNQGYAPMYYPRPVILILRHPTNGTRYMADLSGSGTDADPRYWPSGGPHTFTRNVRIPSMAPGDEADNYTLALWMPDSAEILRDSSGDWKYAVQLASWVDGTSTPIWEGSTGYNILTTGLDVDSGAPANTTPAAYEFVACSSTAMCP
jgi:hypothetical protein